jgi:penicillin-binding protein 1A
MHQACLYTTARLFINCPNETKWESPVKFVKYLLILAVCCILLGAGSIYGLYKYIEPQLPDVATLKDVRLQIPMQVYSADGELDCAVRRKTPYSADLKQIPPEMVKAFIATEDSRFYEHHGVDPVGIFRAASVAFLWPRLTGRQHHHAAARA